jgi:hypothetical protein
LYVDIQELHASLDRREESLEIAWWGDERAIDRTPERHSIDLAARLLCAWR